LGTKRAIGAEDNGLFGLAHAEGAHGATERAVAL